MERSGVPLFIGECAFGDDEFELAPSSSVFHFRCRDVMWQKERLLNLTIDRMPDRYTKIVWVDADVLFTNPRWIVETSERLDEVAVVQPFSHAVRLRPAETSYFGGGERSRGFCFTRSALPATLTTAVSHPWAHRLRAGRPTASCSRISGSTTPRSAARLTISWPMRSAGTSRRPA